MKRYGKGTWGRIFTQTRRPGRENPSKPNKMFHLARWEGSVGSKWKPIVIKMKQMKMLHTVRFPKLLLLIHEIQSLALTPPDRF